MNSNSVKYALITGASMGIGRAMARECAKRGVNLLLVALPGDELGQLADELRDHYGVQVHPFEIDMTSTQASQQIYDWCKANQYYISILINNAGIGGHESFDSSPTTTIEKMLLLNVQATTVLCRLMIPLLKQSQRAHILNVSSTAAFFHIPNKVVYSASKAYIYSFSRGLAAELKNSSISISVLCPGGANNRLDPIVKKKLSNELMEFIHLSPERIANTAIKKMIAGKAVIVPGFASKAYRLVATVLPRPVVTWLVNRLFTEVSMK